MRFVAPTVVAFGALFFAAMVGGGSAPDAPLLDVAEHAESLDDGDVETNDGSAVASTEVPDLGDRADLVLAMVEPSSVRPDELSLADQPAVVVGDLLYDGLTEIDGHTGDLVPALARSWSADASFRRWTFELDRAAGVTAQDVVVALSPLLVGPENQPDTARAAPALTASMASVYAVDEDVVVIELVRPNAGLAWVLSGLPYSVVGVDGRPTGDYEIDRSDELGLWLRRRAARPAPAGVASSIELRWSEDQGSAYRRLLDGEVDGAIVGAEWLGDATRRFGVELSPSTAIRFYVLNPNAEALADRDRRAALLGLFDPGQLVEAAERADLAPLDGLVSPALAGSGADGCGPDCGEIDDGAGPPPTSDFAWSDAPPLLITYAGDGHGAMADALAARLVRAGVPARSTASTAKQLASAIVEGSPALFAFGWVAPASTIDAVVPPLLRTESAANVARFSSAGLEDLLDQASTTGDDEARWALLERAHRLALGESRVLPVAVSTGTLVWSPGWSGAAQRPDGSIDPERSS